MDPTPRQSPLVDFLTDPGRHVPMFDAITQNLGPADIVKLGRVSKALGNVYPAVQKSQWNIDASLKKFFKEPKAFRNALSEAWGVISGIFALDFLDRRAPGNRLDTFLHHEVPDDDEDNFSFLGMEKYLKDQGYTEDTPQRILGQPVDIDMNNDFGFKIYALEGHGASAKLWTTSQNSTALSNIITATKAYAPFARETFKEYRSYLTQEASQWTVGGLHVVETTGRKILDIRQQDKLLKDHARSLSDGMTWTLVLDSEGIQEPFAPEYITDATVFSLSVDKRHGVNFYNVEIEPFDHAVLEHTWYVPEAYHAPLREILDSIAVLSFFRTPKEKWVTELSAYHTHQDVIRNRPDKATNAIAWPHKKPYYDDMMVEWIQEVQKQIKETK